MRCLLLAAAFACLSLPQAVGPAGALPVPPQRVGAAGSAPLLALVERYRHGDAGAALADLVTWDAKRLNDARLRSKERDAQTLAAVALLHTEALFQRRFHDAAAMDMGESDVHFAEAFAAIVALSGRGERRETLRSLCRDWYVLNIAVWTASGMVRRAETLVRAGKREFGDDPRFLLEAGRLGEAQLRSPNRGGVEALRAEGYLRRALDGDPRFFEARLHLGRVLHLVHDRHDARPELERAFADARAAHHDYAAYMAAVFLGQVQQEAGETAAATRSFETAIAICPNAQQGYLALGHLLVASGRIDEGWAVGRRLFGDDTGPRTPDLHPWVWYYDLPLSSADAALREMRAMVRR